LVLHNSVFFGVLLSFIIEAMIFTVARFLRVEGLHASC
jgi:hypothetical protein